MDKYNLLIGVTGSVATIKIKELVEEFLKKFSGKVAIKVCFIYGFYVKFPSINEHYLRLLLQGLHCIFSKLLNCQWKSMWMKMNGACGNLEEIQSYISVCFSHIIPRVYLLTLQLI